MLPHFWSKKNVIGEYLKFEIGCVLKDKVVTKVS